MSSRRKRYADAVAGLERALKDQERAADEVVRAAKALGDARKKVAYYLKRANDRTHERETGSVVVVSKAVPELVDAIKEGARKIADEAGVDVDEGESSAPATTTEKKPVRSRIYKKDREEARAKKAAEKGDALPW